MSAHRLEPAASIIGKIGVDTVALITGKHISRVYRWMYPKDRGGTGGLIPQGDAIALLDYARANGISLSANDFFAKPAVQPERASA